MKKPIAVLIADIHYNLNTLELADAAMRQAILRSNTLNVPLIVAGDLHDTKSSFNGKVINRMIETFDLCRSTPVILRGNHDSLDEKSADTGLNFLAYKASIIRYPCQLHGLHLIPYHHDATELKSLLKSISGTTIMHQGVTGSNSGEYLQDKSAISIDDVKHLRVISGHYHTRQTIGNWDYIGNPYTLNFAESRDPEKGFQILMSDGSLEFVSTNLRKHIVKEHIIYNEVYLNVLWNDYADVRPEDILKIKFQGTREILGKLTKNKIKDAIKIPNNFKLELIPTDAVQKTETKDLTQSEVLDAIITNLDASTELKKRLKQLWRQL